MKEKKIRFRCWVEIDGKKFFGPGPKELLGLIEEEGSIAIASKKMGMSYKKAWDLIDDRNTRGKDPFVVSKKGGSKGGGAYLTETGKQVVSEYHKLTTKLEAVLEKETKILDLI